MPNYRTFGALEEGYLRDHPEEMDEYLTILFDEYAQSGDTAALLRTVQIDNLRQQLQAGIDSGPGLSADEVFARLEAKYHAANRA